MKGLKKIAYKLQQNFEEFLTKVRTRQAQQWLKLDKMLDEKLNEEISEFADDLEKLAEARAQYAVAMRENADPTKNICCSNS